MRVYSGRNIGDFYYKLFNDITNEGKELTIRGKRVKELPEPVTLVYEDPGACWMLIPGRRMNPFFCLAEVMWMWSGRGDVEWISQYNSNMKSFQDGDNPNFHGAYGLRVRKWKPYWGFGWDFNEVDQLEECVKKIVADPYTRQAVISLWHPSYDNGNPSTKDTPCNQLVMFSLRDYKLNMTVVIRSNDLIWGTPHNAIQFSHLLAIATGMLDSSLNPDNEESTFAEKIQMGTLTYVVQNIHYYLDLYPETLGVIRNQAKKFKFSPWNGLPVLEDGPGALKPALFQIPTPDDFKEACSIVFEDTSTNYDYTPNHYWTDLIPRMLLIYNTIKSCNVNLYKNALPEWLEKVGEPFSMLIKDFYSNKPEVLEILNGKS